MPSAERRPFAKNFLSLVETDTQNACRRVRTDNIRTFGLMQEGCAKKSKICSDPRLAPVIRLPHQHRFKTPRFD
jgi:hypothetical protein